MRRGGGGRRERAAAHILFWLYKLRCPNWYTNRLKICPISSWRYSNPSAVCGPFEETLKRWTETSSFVQTVEKPTGRLEKYKNLDNKGENNLYVMYLHTLSFVPLQHTLKLIVEFENVRLFYLSRLKWYWNLLRHSHPAFPTPTPPTQSRP